jgi:hypothetical protein
MVMASARRPAFHRHAGGTEDGARLTSRPSALYPFFHALNRSGEFLAVSTAIKRLIVATKSLE